MSELALSKSHRVLRLIVAFAVGLALAIYAYRWASNPEPAMQKAREEIVVMGSREILTSYVAPGSNLEIVDPLAKNRAVGKVFVFPADDGWEVSGHYRRDEHDRWHPFLMRLDDKLELVSLAVSDDNERLIGMSAQDPKLSAIP